MKILIFFYTNAKNKLSMHFRGIVLALCIVNFITVCSVIAYFLYLSTHLTCSILFIAHICTHVSIKITVSCEIYDQTTYFCSKYMDTERISPISTSHTYIFIYLSASVSRFSLISLSISHISSIYLPT